MTETPNGEKMDFKQPQVDHRQPKDEKRCPNAPPEAQEAAEAAALGEQVSSAGTQSCVPPLQSSCSSPGPSSAQGAAQTLSGPGSVLEAPEPGEEEEREVCHPLEPCRGENHMERELSQGEVSRIPKPSQGENNSNKTLPRENWRCITIRTVWINPSYPELLQEPLQEEAKAATPSTSDEQVPAAAGTQSPAPGSPCCSPCSSQTQLAARTLGDLQRVHRQPSSPRRTLQALCTLLWCSCMELQLGD
ncbi:uncharacterized protein LOC128806262 [Vidua macroura]|uniref:uncharacterized protein LOC128806262 n=1 Tax=Vidua macroura TaxID=187451 RepID=UPI0023A7B8B1|nr:uncharacterized protein LOC128806262 [Vidua macroura]